MTNTLLAAALLALVPPASAQTALPPSLSVPGIQPQVIDLSLVEALVAVKRTELAGIFGFVPEAVSSLAFADYLMRQPKALKLFVKKVEKDKKVARGISVWDRQVLLHLVSIDASGGALGVKKIEKKMMDRISVLSLSEELLLETIVQRRDGR
ncbi:MAG TPA: hypothetical protein DCM05_16085 [Elusimicrobia bacterium]|nr:hypothetical protein [Elusimicrobiota bacterium]